MRLRRRRGHDLSASVYYRYAAEWTLYTVLAIALGIAILTQLIDSDELGDNGEIVAGVLILVASAMFAYVAIASYVAGRRKSRRSPPS